MLDKEFKYFKDHQEELTKKYDNRVLLIVGNSVVEAYDTEIDAYMDAQRRGYEKGRFLVQRCAEGNEVYTQTFHSRISLTK